jgi:lysozyme
MMRSRAIGLAVAPAALLAAVALGRARSGPPVPESIAVWGVDVSHHQGTVDWSAVAREPRLRFAYVKATEGGDWTDPRFAENWRGARGAGLRVGAYHYFTFCRAAEEQASHFLSVLPREPDALDPAVDVEFEGNCANPPPNAVIATNIRRWLSAVERSVGRTPVVYVTRQAYTAFVVGDTLGNPLWLRSPKSQPSGVNWLFWQLADDARVAGIQGDVDVDAFAGNAQALEMLRR